MAKLAPNITLSDAREIVCALVERTNISGAEETNELPNIYFAPGMREKMEAGWKFKMGDASSGMLKSSRFICVCKMTGKVLYDGSSNDEG